MSTGYRTLNLSAVAATWHMAQDETTNYSRLVELRKGLEQDVQESLTDSLLAELAAALEDGTVFEIVRELESIQQLSERSVLNQRMKVVSSHKLQKAELTRRQQQEGTSSSHAEEQKILERRLAEELRRADQQIIGQLDQLVTEQQSTLSQAAVPCFSVTSDPDKIKLQMCVLSLISQLAPNH